MLTSYRKIRKHFKREDHKIYDKIFWFSTEATATLLVIFSTIVSSQQFFGSPISCYVDKEKKLLKQNYVNGFCWIQETFTVIRKINGSVGSEVAHPGVAEYAIGDEVQHHSYYQWVCFMLFFQALCFYFPHYLWLIWENKLVAGLLKDFDFSTIKKDKKGEKLKILVENFVEYFSFHTNYATKFFFCEFLALLNVVIQMILIDCFLDWEFSSYGREVLRFLFSDQARNDPMTKIFPKVTKCLYLDYGSSGEIKRTDVLCILSLNIVNEKVFIFLWFWFILILIFTSSKQIFRIIFYLSPTLRLHMLRLGTKRIKIENFKIINEKSTIDDWFLIHQVSKNVTKKNFTEIIEKLAEKLVDMEIRGEIKNKKNLRKNSLEEKIWKIFVDLLKYGDFLF